MAIEMAKHVRTTIRYDGPALGSHEMDVQDLAPALLALADMIQIANRKFNGDKADIRVLVNADVEQKCFMIDLSLVMSFLDQAKTFLDSDRVKTAREIAEWIGLIGGGALTAGGGAFALLKLLKGGEQTPFQISAASGHVVVITGEGAQVTFAPETLALVQDKGFVDKAKTVMRPLSKPGYSEVSFVQGKDEVVTIEREEAERILAAPSDSIVDTPSESVSHIRGVVRIKSPQYEGNAKWSLLWNGRAIDAEMVGPAADWVASFQANKVDAPPNTVLDVSMTETVRLNDRGEAVGRALYTVHEVHKATPPPAQPNLF